MSDFCEHSFTFINSKDAYSDKLVEEINPDLILWYGWSWLIPDKIFKNYPSTLKIFIKETASEYYNLVLDRVYRAKEDGNLWLSFPSSDRDKINKDDFIILKNKKKVSGVNISFSESLDSNSKKWNFLIKKKIIEPMVSENLNSAYLINKNFDCFLFNKENAKFKKLKSPLDYKSLTNFIKNNEKKT